MRVQVGQSRDLARLAVWYIATRLGKGVAMSFVLVMFTLQFSHVEPDLTFISITFTYFVLTQHKWTGQHPSQTDSKILVPHTATHTRQEVKKRLHTHAIGSMKVTTDD